MSERETFIYDLKSYLCVFLILFLDWKPCVLLEGWLSRYIEEKGKFTLLLVLYCISSVHMMMKSRVRSFLWKRLRRGDYGVPFVHVVDLG
ncbi:hypothetical protein V8B55DRAFT_1522744 [Mucor lusitanicus]|uniref:Uncharacterized protein n=1 Tax=Mucor circinelloides f. lusitanicus TaxID=29924 RepID=A0A8H4BAN6_MUCCL|nr:hypothetical protein FB192DRAFT_1393090 [Mucor lusitanicus]